MARPGWWHRCPSTGRDPRARLRRRGFIPAGVEGLPRGDVYAKAIELLEWQLRSATETRSYEAYVPVADDGWLTYSAPWDGPVVEAWQTTLTPVDNLESALRLRRVRRLLGEHDVEQIRAGFRDATGRYVLMVDLESGPPSRSLAEWPASLQVVSAWTDRTVLAAGNPDAGAVTLLALTPTEDRVAARGSGAAVAAQ